MKSGDAQVRIAGLRLADNRLTAKPAAHAPLAAAVQAGSVNVVEPPDAIPTSGCPAGTTGSNVHSSAETCTLVVLQSPAETTT